MTRHLLQVVCNTCDPNVPISENWSENMLDLASMMLACHAQRPHTAGHELIGVVDGVFITTPLYEPENPMFEVHLTCEYCAARPPKSQGLYMNAVYKVSRAEFVPAVCLHWHSMHEGHTLKCRVRENGGEWEQLHPPVEQEADSEAAA